MSFSWWTHLELHIQPVCTVTLIWSWAYTNIDKTKTIVDSPMFRFMLFPSGSGLSSLAKKKGRNGGFRHRNGRRNNSYQLAMQVICSDFFEVIFRLDGVMRLLRQQSTQAARIVIFR